MTRRPAGMALALALSISPVGACSGSDDGTITVFAAASLTDVMSDLARAFETHEAGIAVAVSTGPSSGLRESILAGAPADVFASADLTNMAALADAGEVDAAPVFTTNSMVIAVPHGNPAGVVGLDDFERGDLLLGLCAPQVPCGVAARTVFDSAGVHPSIDTEATDVRALLTQVASGDLDAGIVYRTDVMAADGDVAGIDIPAAVNVVVEYPIAVLAGSGNADRAAEFVAFVLSPEGQEIVRAGGFGRP